MVQKQTPEPVPAAGQGKNVSEHNGVFPRLLPLVFSLSTLIRRGLWAQVLFAMVLGISVGLLVSPEGLAIIPADAAIALGNWLAVPGKVFLALIQMIVVMLISSSIILGIASGESETLKKVGFRIAPYFVLTTLVAALIGAFMVNTIQPSKWMDPAKVEALTASEDFAIPPAPEGKDNPIHEKIVEIIPANPLEAFLNLNMFQVVIFAILIGIAIATIRNRENAKLLLDFTSAIMEVAMKVVSWAMQIAPLAVFGLLAQVSIKTGIEAFVGLGMYVITVLAGLLGLMAFYLLVVSVLARRNPFRFMRNLTTLQLLAFSTSSSAAVVPLSISTAIDKLNIKPAIARFLIPLGATVNMDGTALYQVVAVVFLTQLFGVDLSTLAYMGLIVTIVGASIGTPSTPGVAIVVLATILADLGIPATGLALIIGVDRILDMSRTAVNVTGDLMACSVMERWVGADIEENNPTASSGSEENA